MLNLHLEIKINNNWEHYRCFSDIKFPKEQHDGLLYYLDRGFQSDFTEITKLNYYICNFPKRVGILHLRGSNNSINSWRSEKDKTNRFWLEDIIGFIFGQGLHNLHSIVEDVRFVYWEVP